MDRLSISTKEEALKLRAQGYSVEEISKKLNIAKSTSSVLTRGIKLNKKAVGRIEKRKLFGYRKAALRWKEKRKKQNAKNLFLAKEVASNIKRDKFHNKIYCSLLYWCEGNKGEKEGVRFVNSDPTLVKTFLNLFRSSFLVDENKFRALMHLHEYHDEQKQKKFWSKITKIPENHFHKTFLKSNTKKRIKNEYPGCIAIYYNDCDISREIKLIYKVFSE